MANKKLLERLRPYVAPKGSPKKDIADPCIVCGWSAHCEIHQNPRLIKRGKGPYHKYVARKYSGRPYTKRVVKGEPTGECECENLGSECPTCEEET